MVLYKPLPRPSVQNCNIQHLLGMVYPAKMLTSFQNLNVSGVSDGPSIKPRLIAGNRG